MTFVPRLIARVRGAGRPAQGTGNPPRVYSGEEMARFDALWDEALTAAMQCDAARMYLDHMGPRWK